MMYSTSVSMPAYRVLASIAWISLLFSVGCTTSKYNKQYSVFHVSTLNEFASPSTKYIRRHAGVILHFRSQEMDKAIKSIQSVDTGNEVVSGFESNTYFRRNSDGLEYRLGINGKCDYLIVDNEDKGVCSEIVYQKLIEIFKMHSF